MSRYTDHMLSFHRPRGMSCSHYRNVVKNRCHEHNRTLCLKEIGVDSWCVRVKGHEGDCDDIPF